MTRRCGVVFLTCSSTFHVEKMSTYVHNRLEFHATTQCVLTKSRGCKARLEWNSIVKPETNQLSYDTL